MFKILHHKWQIRDLNPTFFFWHHSPGLHHKAVLPSTAGVATVHIFFYIFAILEKEFDFMQWLETSESLAPTGNPSSLGVRQVLKREDGGEWRAAMVEPLAGPWGWARGSLEAEHLKSKRHGRARADWGVSKVVSRSGHFCKSIFCWSWLRFLDL